MWVAIELVGKNQVVDHQTDLEVLVFATFAYTSVCSTRALNEIWSSVPNKKQNPISFYHLSSSFHIYLPPSSSSSLFGCCHANERFSFFFLTKIKLVLGIFVMMVSMVCCLRKMHKMFIFSSFFLLSSWVIPKL